MNVLVVGGTGFVGTALCTELVERGHDVTALSRDPAAADLPESVSTAAGDVTDYDSIEGAFEGRETVVNLVALSPLFRPRGGSERHFDVHLRGTENVVRAAERHGVARLVQQSALGADPAGPTAYIRVKGAAEAVVRNSDLDWMIVRPSVIFGDGGEFVPFTKLLTTPYVTGLPGGGSSRFQPIWLGDLAPMIADAAVTDATVADDRAGETYELGGPEVLTLADVARAAYRAEGKSLRVLPVPMVLARVGLTLAGVVPGVPMGADQYRSLQFDNTVDRNDVGAFDVEAGDLVTLREYLTGSTSGGIEGLTAEASEGSTAEESEGSTADGSDEPTDGGGDAGTTYGTDGGTRDVSEAPVVRGSDDGRPEPLDRATDGGSGESGDRLFTAPSAFAVFALLVASWSVPLFVDVYANVFTWLAFLPSYLVTLFVWDAGPEVVVELVVGVAPVDGHVLWEAGNLLTYYLVAVALVWSKREIGRFAG